MGGKNRIVVDYGEYEGLVLLAAFNTKTGNEITRTELHRLKSFELVKKYDGLSNHSELKGLIANDAEGFVVRFSNGSRMKVKGEEYVRLHKIMTNISTKGVWDTLANGESMGDLLNNVPDEFYDKIRAYEKTLVDSFNMIDQEYRWIFKRMFTPDVSKSVKDFKEDKDLRKIFAKNAQRFKHPHILYAMLDGKTYDHIIWKKLKPKFEKL